MILYIYVYQYIYIYNIYIYTYIYIYILNSSFFKTRLSLGYLFNVHVKLVKGPTSFFLGNLHWWNYTASWRFDKVYESYAAKCGGNGVSLRAMEDAAKQFATETQ